MHTYSRSTAMRWACVALATLVLAACATGPRISAEADPRVDFAQFRTYGFYSPLAVEGEGYQTPASQRMRAAVRSEMEARGYAYAAEDPDLWVNINAFLERRSDVSSVPYMDYGYYYSYRAQRYVAVPFWNDRVDVHRYTEGTLNVDLVDARRNALVWEGVAVGRVANLRASDRDARIDGTIAAIFARYPYRAGSAHPDPAR